MVGGGAAGFFGAIAAAESDCAVTILEAGRTILTKVRISGGGRCNVTHACFDPALLVQHYPRGGKALRGPLTRFQPRDTVAWFEQRGVRLKTEADGRMFPVTDDSATIVDCLVRAALQWGIAIRTGVPAIAVQRREAGFELQLKSGEVVVGDRLLLATGGSPQGYRLARALGHTIVPPVPSLFTFNVRDPRLQDLAGVSVPNAHLRLQFAAKSQLEQSGPLLVTHWGLSGPAVLKLSAWGARLLNENHYRAQLRVNWLPSLKGDAVRLLLLQAKDEMPQRAIAAHCPFDLPKRLWRSLVSDSGIDSTTRWAELSKQALHRLGQEISDGQFEVCGKGVFKDEFVTCGGVALKEVDFKRMESRLCPGLHLAGEILDIDGVTGGFNFQSAWTTAWIAGRAMAPPKTG